MTSPSSRAPAPHLVAPPSYPELIGLPAELHEMICGYLHIDDILALRRTCYVLRDSTITSFGKEVPLVYSRPKFEALKCIAQHYQLATRMKSLCYVFDRMEGRSPERWNAERIDGMKVVMSGWDDSDSDSADSILDSMEPGHSVAAFLDHIAGDSDHEMESSTYYHREEVCQKKRESRHAMRVFSMSRTAIPEGATGRWNSRTYADYLRGHYEAFREVCRDQDKIRRERFDYDCLTSLFEGCLNIREVTMASKAYCNRELKGERSAFRDTLMRLTHDGNGSRAGVAQTSALLEALCQSGTKLNSLTLAGISHKVFDRFSTNGEIMSDRLRATVRSLHRLRLFIQACPPHLLNHKYDGSADHSLTPNASVFIRGHVYEVLKEARELRVLKLELLQCRPDRYDDTYVRLVNVLAYKTQDTIIFPHLYELALSQCRCDGKLLIAIVANHRSTLRRVTLSHMTLETHSSEYCRCNWEGVFIRLSRLKVPNLRKVRLRGDFCDADDTPICFSDPGVHLSRITPYTKDMENFIVKGGNYPSEDLPVRHYHFQGYNALNCLHVACVDSGLPDDNRPIDDPANYYTLDEFDEGM
jgi:hypothetical protein